MDCPFTFNPRGADWRYMSDGLHNYTSDMRRLRTAREIAILATQIGEDLEGIRRLLLEVDEVIEQLQSCARGCVRIRKELSRSQPAALFDPEQCRTRRDRPLSGSCIR